MKRTISNLAVIVLVAASSISATAQHTDHHAPAPSDADEEAHMHQGMQEMMADPAHRIMMAPCLLPELEKELGLSAEQAERLRELRTEAMADEDAMAALREASGEALAILSEEQRSDFEQLDHAVLHEAAMAHMHGADEECPMMDGKVMGAPEGSTTHPESTGGHDH